MRPRLTISGILLAASLLVSAHVSADALTRQTAIRMALEQNPQIAAARAQTRQAAALKAQANAARGPTLTLDVGLGPSLQADLVPGTAAQSRQNAYGDVGFDDLSVFVGGKLDVLQPLYTFGKIGHRRRAAEHGIRARRAQTQMTRAQIALEVARLYEGYLFARDAERFFEDVKQMVEPSIDSTRSRLEAGKTDVTDADLMQLQTARSAAILQSNRAASLRRQAAGGLRAYLGMPEGDDLEVLEPGLERLGGEAGELSERVRTATQQRPELLALQQGSRGMDALAEAEQAGDYPDFFALAGVSGAYTPGRDLVQSRYIVDPLHHFAPYLLVGMRWQLQPGMAGARASEYRAASLGLKGQRRWALQGIPAEVRRYHEEVRRARADLEEAVMAAKRAKQWIIHAGADYAMGLANSRAFFDSVEGFVLMRVAYMDAKYRHNIALAELAKATGTLGIGEDSTYPGPPSEAPVDE